MCVCWGVGEDAVRMSPSKLEAQALLSPSCLPYPKYSEGDTSDLGRTLPAGWAGFNSLSWPQGQGPVFFVSGPEPGVCSEERMLLKKCSEKHAWQNDQKPHCLHFSRHLPKVSSAGPGERQAHVILPT